jgi:hypothetical protein
MTVFTGIQRPSSSYRQCAVLPQELLSFLVLKGFVFHAVPDALAFPSSSYILSM